ncbi:MAG: hypothetical protein K2X66_18570 [Cyanobacteria bacterium]|nr:hypothetical protein [Cyanobacteriota bacterium]
MSSKFDKAFIEFKAYIPLTDPKAMAEIFSLLPDEFLDEFFARDKACQARLNRYLKSKQGRKPKPRR